MKSFGRIFTVVLCFLLFTTNICISAESQIPNSNEDGKPLDKFNNALYQGQDPFVTYKDGYYYFVSSSNLDSNNKIYVSKSKSLLDQGEKIMVFDSEGSQTRIYAPEIFFIQGKWYIYYCADFRNKGLNHFAGVLEAVTDDPQGEYEDKGPLYTGEQQREMQANDFTVFEYEGQLYGVWGTMPDYFKDQPPAPAIAKMDSPTLITEDRTIMLPKGGEGPRAIIHDGKLFITVSHGGFANLNYHLSMYTFKGGDILDTKNWTFKDNVFNGTDDVYSAGRASFVKSADGTEDWMMYHSKVYKAEDNGWRNVNIQKFT